MAEDTHQGGGSRAGRQNRGQPFALHLLPIKHYARFMILFENIFSLSFCLVKQLPLNFSVSSSTDKGAEVTFFFFLLKDYHIVGFVFQLGVFILQEVESSARKPSCNFTNVTFQLWNSSDI